MEQSTVKGSFSRKALGGQGKKVGIRYFMLSILNKLLLIQFVEPTKSIRALLSRLAYRLHNGSQKSFHDLLHKYLVSLYTRKCVI